MAGEHVPNSCPMKQSGIQAFREGPQLSPEEADEILSPHGRQAIETRMPPELRLAPPQHTPPTQVRHIVEMMIS